MDSLIRWRHQVAQLKNSEYLRNFARLTTAAGIAALIGILSTPLVTRLYTPVDYGLAANFASLVALFAPIAALRYDLAIVLPEDDNEAAAVFWLSVLIVVVSLAIGFLVVVFAWGALPTQVVVVQFGALLLLLPVTIGLSAFVSILNSWATRKQNFSLIARNRLVAAIVSPVISIGGFLISGSTPVGLILAAFLSVLSSLPVLLAGIKLPSRRHLTRGSLRQQAHIYRQFPQFNLWMTLLDQITVSLPILLFTSIFGPTVTAYFLLANTTLQLPSAIVGHAAAQVFYERAARQKQNPRQLRKLLNANIQGLALLMLIPTLLTIIAGPPLFKLVFGPAWGEAGEFARLLIPAIVLTFIASPISLLPTILNQQHTHLALALISFGGRVLTLFLGIQSGSASLTVALYSFGECVGLLIFFGWLFYYLRKLERLIPVTET